MEGVKLEWRATAPGVRSAYESISAILPEGAFVLAGGTALALLEAHRISVDLDFFGPRVDPEGLLRSIESELARVEVRSIAPGTLHLAIGGVQVSFLESRYPRVAPPLPCGEGLVPLASREDIAAMKLAAVASRGSKKDFVDLWVLITRHEPLWSYLRAFRKKYAARDVGHVLRSLVYFSDAENEPPLRLLVPLDWNVLKRDFERWVREAMESDQLEDGEE